MTETTPTGAADAVCGAGVGEKYALDIIRLAFVKDEFVKRLNMLVEVASLSSGTPLRLDRTMPATEILAEWQKDAKFVQALVDSLATHAGALMAVVDQQMKDLQQLV